MQPSTDTSTLYLGVKMLWSFCVLHTVHQSLISVSPHSGYGFWSLWTTYARVMGNLSHSYPVCGRTTTKSSDIRPHMGHFSGKDASRTCSVWILRSIPCLMITRSHCQKLRMSAHHELLFLCSYIARSFTQGPAWTAEDGYDLIDRYHLAYGEYEYTSFARAAQCIECGQFERARLLSANVPIPTTIWTCISVGGPIVLRKVLSSVKDIDWLHQVPEHIIYWRKFWSGYSSRTGEDLRKNRELGWTGPWPPTFTAIARAMNHHPGSEVPCAKYYTQVLWQAGGFLELSLCRRLARAGASIDGHCRDDGMSALHIVAALWEHDIVEILIDLGADPTSQTSNRLTALQLFLYGPENVLKEELPSFLASSRAAFKRVPLQEQQRRRKSRILSKLQALCKAPSTQSPLDQRDARGRYPLMIAVQSSQTATEGLIRAGANVEQTDG
jgi:hypothetical protein